MLPQGVSTSLPVLCISGILKIPLTVHASLLPAALAARSWAASAREVNGAINGLASCHRLAPALTGFSRR